MRKLQNIISIFGNVVTDIVVRQGNQLVVRIESLRSLRARHLSTLRSYASELALVLRSGDWQGPYLAWNKPRVGTATCFASAMTTSLVAAVVKQDQRRHQIMCHRAAA